MAGITCHRCGDDSSVLGIRDGHTYCEQCLLDIAVVADLLEQRDQARRIAVALEQDLALAREVYGCAQCRWHVSRERSTLHEASERHLGFHIGAEVPA